MADDSANQNANSGANGGGAAGGNNDASNKDAANNGNQGVNDPEKQRLSQEAAKYRTQLRAREQELESLKREIEEAKAKSDASPGNDKDASDLAKLRRDFGDLKKQLETERSERVKAVEASKAKDLEAAIRKAVSDAKLLDPDDAAIIIRQRGRAKIADDGKAVIVVSENGEEREVEISPDSIKQFKVVGERFYPSAGVGGAGSRSSGGTRQAAPNGFSYERALSDPIYQKEHLAEFKAEARRRIGGGA